MPQSAREKKLADKYFAMTEHERGIWDRGLEACGIDEVGRGPLAGPVVTACVCLPRTAVILGIDDSKKLSEKKREELYPKILAGALYARTCFIGEGVIDEINILNATKRAMEECAKDARGVFLVDAVSGLALPGEAVPIVHGDALSYVIAAASIVAKVERDRFMREMDEVYPQYGFARNKGYGTREHIEALRRYGPCPIHRRSFIGGIAGV